MNFLKKLYCCIFVWNIPAASDKEMRQADVIVTQACGRLKNGKPGPGNEAIIKTAIELCEKYHLPIIAEYDAAMARPDYPFEAIVGGSNINELSTTNGWNTYVSVEKQIEICKEKGWKKAIVAAFPEHMGRAIWTYQKLGLEVMPAPMPDTQYFHPDLMQWSHRDGKLRFCIRELVVRVLSLVWWNWL